MVQVRCSVVDIRTTEPKLDDSFLVDTNAWYWMTYTRATLPCLPTPRRRQIEQYLRFVKKALDVGSTVGRCDLALAELAHRIEDTELKIYSHHHAAETPIRIKDYRQKPAERTRVISEVESVWYQVTKMSECWPLTVDVDATNGALAALKAYLVDGYDVFILQSMRKHGVAAILTDDSDFSSVPDITVFTCNETVIREATRQKKLVAR